MIFGNELKELGIRDPRYKPTPRSSLGSLAKTSAHTVTATSTPSNSSGSARIFSVLATCMPAARRGCSTRSRATFREIGSGFAGCTPSDSGHRLRPAPTEITAGRVRFAKSGVEARVGRCPQSSCDSPKTRASIRPTAVAWASVTDATRRYETPAASVIFAPTLFSTKSAKSCSCVRLQCAAAGDAELDL